MILSTLTDPAILTDAELDQLRRDVLTEQERRVKVESLPDDLAAMARDAVQAGCDPDALRATFAAAIDGEEPLYV